MSWPSRFQAVPVDCLHIAEELSLSEKSSIQQLRSYIRNVPEIYNYLHNGVSPRQLESSLAVGTAFMSRDLAQTYHLLFAPSGRDGRIEAEYVNGDLIVTRGRHRVEIARREGLPYVPVHVRASGYQELARVTTVLENRISIDDSEIVEIHRRLNEWHKAIAPVQDVGRVASDEGGSVSFESEVPGRKSPEFEPQPRVDNTVPNRARVERTLGALAVSQQLNSPEVANRERIARTLGRVANESVRDEARSPTRDRS